MPRDTLAVCAITAVVPGRAARRGAAAAAAAAAAVSVLLFPQFRRLGLDFLDELGISVGEVRDRL